MVRAKRPTRDQKMLIAKAGLDLEDWLVKCEKADKLHLVHKILGIGKAIEK